MTLPGSMTQEAERERMIRVDHAGEYGAKRIYEGQLAVLGKKPGADIIRHMAEQEQVHLETFNQMISERKIRPTLLMPLWHVGGFALGAVTALMGQKAAMACTVAVETVIDEHYAAQVAQLGEHDAPLKDTIEKFRQEEIEHRDTGLAHGAEEAHGYEALSAGIRSITRGAIWLSTRF